MTNKETTMIRISLCFALAACSAATTDNFVNPPPGPPAACTPIADLTGCDQGSVSYSCVGDRPDDGDANLVCSSGTPAAEGAALYCCAPYAQADSECTVDTTIDGCDAMAIGFACTGSVTPSDADPTIACGSALAGADGAQRYCCNTAATIPTCAIDPTVTACTGIAVGYSCAGTDSPFAGNPAFACAPEGAGGYCCIPFAQAAGTCEQDTSGACGADSYGFTCDGTTPDALDPALHCTAGPGALSCCELD